MQDLVIKAKQQNKPVNYVSPDKATEMVAKKSNIKIVKITLHTRGGNILDTITIIAGNSLKKTPIPFKKENKFLGWVSDTNAATTYFNFSQPLQSDIVLYAMWQAQISSHTITFNTNGGNIIENSNVISGDTLTFPIYPIKDGYTFLGWYTDLGLSKYYNFNDIVISNFTLYAKWNANTNTITFNTNGGSTIGDSIIMSGNKLIPPVAPTKSGYIFVGWYSNEGLTTQYDFNTAVTNILHFMLNGWKQLLLMVKHIKL